MTQPVKLRLDNERGPCIRVEIGGDRGVAYDIPLTMGEVNELIRDATNIMFVSAARGR